MTSGPAPLKLERLRRPAVLAAVLLTHLAVFAVLGRSQPLPPPAPANPPFEVILFRPPPPPPPEPPPEPARQAGGGAPAAPSRVHVPPKAPERPPEPPPPAPEVQAPEPSPIVVGVAPTESPSPGMGQGGSGTGSGTGTGSGSGPGSGSRPRLVRGPNQGQILREYPRGALEARQAGRGVIACRIRLDTRLEACRVVSETPEGQGFGRAALTVSAHFRFQPPTQAGRPVAGQEVTLGVDFEPRR